MTRIKKDCFLVWRGYSGLKLMVGISRNSRLSRLALDVAIMDLDPFQYADGCWISAEARRAMVSR